MLAELRTKSQITIPKSIVLSLKLKTGDMLDISENDGMICICPVVVYPKAYVEELQEEVKNLKSDIKTGKKTVYNNIDSMFDSIEG